ncbi:MAG TPA: hypothetical protein PKK43_11755, partial [Spirochaetota bacterium]|nr:hypothetical protein [Spirochaetota bacterium]
PEIILPTHNSEKELKYAASIWKCLYSADSEIEFTGVTDSGKRAHRFILMGTNGKLNGKRYHAKKISGVVE